MADLDGDGSLELLASGSADRSLFVYRTTVGGAGNAALWPTARGNAARTGNAIPPGTPLVDRIPPRAIANLRLERLGAGTAEVSWSAPFGGLRQRVARYEARVGDNHHHVVCRTCGAIADVDCAVDTTPCLTASHDHGFVIDEAEVIYWGLCPACSTPPHPAMTERTPSG